MAKSQYIELVVIRGTVKEVKGLVSDPWSVLRGSAPEIKGMQTTEALNACHKQGYDHFEIEEDGEKKIYRLKLRP